MTASNREKLEEQLLGLFYGELSDADMEALEAQLADEPALQAQLDQWHELRRVVSEMPLAEPDPQVRYDLLRAARKAVAEPVRGRWWAWLEPLSTAPAVAGLALAVIAGSLLFTVTADFSDHSPESSPSMAANPTVESSARLGDRDAPRARPVTLGVETEESEALADPVPAGGPTDGLVTALDAVSALEPNEAPAPPLTKGRKTRSSKKSTAAKSTYKAKKKLRKRRVQKKRLEFSSRDGASAAPAPFEDRQNAVAPPPVIRKQPAKAQKRRFAQAPPSPSPSPSAASGEMQNEGRSRTSSSIGSTALGGSPQAPLQGTFGDDSDDGLSVPEAAAADSPSLSPLPKPKPRYRGMPQPSSAKSKEQGVGDSNQLLQVLSRARNARNRGAHRMAVREYETYLRGKAGQPNLDGVWFEAAQSYEALGDLGRARQLYLLVAGTGGPQAVAARRRIASIDSTSRPPASGPDNSQRNSSKR